MDRLANVTDVMESQGGGGIVRRVREAGQEIRYAKQGGKRVEGDSWPPGAIDKRPGKAIRCG